MVAEKLPNKISPCPIVEAVVEIRYESAIPADAILGIVYASFRDYFPKNPVNLPILQLPEQIRNNDPDLIFKPHYKFSDDKFIFQVGPRSLSFSTTGEYIGWTLYSKKITECFTIIRQSGIIKNISRFGLRYINFFLNADIYSKINLSLVLNDKSLSGDKLTIRAVLPAGAYFSTLQISNDATLKKDNIESKGSIIDIDVFKEKDIPSLEEIYSTVQGAHSEEKRLFFNLLSEDYLKSLNPEY